EDALALSWLAFQAGAVETSAAMAGDDTYGQRVDTARIESYLQELGYDPQETLRNGVSGTVTRTALELWLEGLGEKNVRRLTDENLQERVTEVADRTGSAPPVWGKQILRDGRSGEP